MEKWQEALALISLRETELQESFEKGQAHHMLSRILQIRIYTFYSLFCITEEDTLQPSKK